jgi:MoaA/NifB/PqqE/SkfB family radical SAM enzyme
MGYNGHSKLRFFGRHYLPRYLPAFVRRRAEIRRGERGRLEDLFVFLTNQCNARCKHCFYIDELGHVPGEMRLGDYQKLAPTLPKLDRVILTGGEAILHPQCREITRAIGTATGAARVTLITNGFLPQKIEDYCRGILAGHEIPGALDILLSIDGLKDTHNTIRGNPGAWDKANETLRRLDAVKREFGDRVDFGVITIITARNFRELEALNDHFRSKHPVARHGFEFIRGTGFSLWGLAPEYRTDYDPPSDGLPPEGEWDHILEMLHRINRRNGIMNHSFHLNARFTVEMLRTKRKLVECVSAGQNVGVLYATGEVAVCEFSKPFGNLREYGMDFGRAWNSEAADAMRRATSRCHCTHGCYLSKNIEYSLAGQLAMLKHL